jgi:hypothetical protein
MLVFALAATTSWAACRRSAPVEPYTGVFPTKEAAAQAVVDAIAAGDVARLESLAVTAVEFRKNIWPHLPASHPDVGMPAEYVWADTHTKSRGTLAETIREHRGRRAAVEKLTFDGPPADYGPFRVHRQTHVTLRDEAGRRHDAQLFGSMLESRAGWKVFSYVVD